MMKRVGGWWFADAPAERLAAMRILVGTYALVWVVARMVELDRVARLPERQFGPVGPITVLDGPLPRVAVLAIAVATALLMAAFVAGVAYRAVAPVAAAALVWTLSYRNSWGVPFHTENLLVLHVAALACAPAADAWAFRPIWRGARAGYGWPIKLMVALTAATYLLAGIAKLRIAGLAWLDGDLLRNQIAYDNVRKAVLGDRIAPLATTFLEHGPLLIAFSAATLAIELGAPLALLGGRIARLWALGAWGFHLGMVLLMNIWFPYPLFGIAFIPVLAPETWVARAREWRRARRR